jgi:cytochrome c-type biogenesis protein CcmH/NrfG
MSWRRKLIPHSAPMILVVLTVAAATGFAAVGHLVTRYTLNQQARGRKLYKLAMADANAGHYDDAIAAFRAALSCDPSNSQYQLSLARALRDSNDPTRLDEAESYLVALWQRTPQDAAVNLALARVAAHRGSIDDAMRYYHNAMYGVWNSDPDGNRNRARIELIEFLLQKRALAQADSELIALSASLPPDPAARLQAAHLFDSAQDYSGALAQYQFVLRVETENPAALAGAGEAAYHAGNYTMATRYLRTAVQVDAHNLRARELQDQSELILASNPFHSHISDAERNRRITTNFTQAEGRLILCASQVGVDLANPQSNNPQKDSPSANPPQAPSASPLLALQARWLAIKPQLQLLRSPAETDLPDEIMDLVFQIEQQAASTCGQPEGRDLALLMISQKREAASQ